MLTIAVLLTFLVHISSAFELTNSVQLTTGLTSLANHSSSLTSSSTTGVISSTTSCGCVHIVDVVRSPLGVGIFFLQPLC